MKKIVMLAVLLCAVSIGAKDKIKVACVGNSVTYGYGIEDRDVNSYPAQLQKMLGSDYDVRNFGRSSATLTSRSPMAYVKQPEYREAIDFKADIVVIHLGLNDTDPRWWPNYSEDFIPEYRALIDSFRVANPKARVWACLLSPIGHQHHRFQSGTRDWHAQVSDAIRKVAQGAGAGLIDLFAPLYCHPDLLPDALHPNAEGAGILARTVYQSLTGDYGGLHMPAAYTDNMVLQRGEPIIIRGNANAGDKVEVVLTQKKDKREQSIEKNTATANSHGQWSVELPAMEAGGPYTLTVKSYSGKGAAGGLLIYNNVWMGDVWLCSGQSNMEFTLSQCSTASADLAQLPFEQRLHILSFYPVAATDDVEWQQAVLDSVNALKYMSTAGWQQCSSLSPADAMRLSAVAYHFGRTLCDSLPQDVHIGLICNPVGGTPTEAWIDRWTLQYEYPQILYDWLHNDHIQDWVRGRAAKNIALAASKLQRHPYEPCYMYESGIRQLEGTTLRGVIWYQGESNAHNSELHERLFPLLQQSWRKAFRCSGPLPFYFVQLSSLSRPSWPRFRNSQRLMAEQLPSTWMAVTTDIGDSLNVHPVYKKEVGRRLALQALRHSYGRTLVSQGPTPLRISRQGDALAVDFGNATQLLTSDGEPVRTFEVAGSDGIFYPAAASIEGSIIKVRAENVAHPVSVRYGWQPFTRANLVNEAGQPASTFCF